MLFSSKINCAIMVFLGVFLLNQTLIANEINFLEDFGLEAFEEPKTHEKNDSNKNNELDLKAAPSSKASAPNTLPLPPHILLETLEADAALDAVDLDTPTEPGWTGIEQEVVLSAVSSKECCLRAIRSTRYEVEMQCREKGHQIWAITSAPVQHVGDEVIRKNKQCVVYHTPESLKELKRAQEGLEPREARKVKITPDFYRCRVRSLAKCFDPAGENAIFATE